MEEYLKILLEQIRCKKAHPLVENEIRGHIEDQMEENLSFGMPRREAEAMAVRDMGDPVEAGVSLDRIHRPQIAWSMVVIVGIISLVSILIQSQLGKDTSMFSYIYVRHTAFTIIGFLMMLIVYRIDYSILGNYGRWIGGIFLLSLTLLPFRFGVMLNGSSRFMILGGISISTSALLYLFLPVYGSILYQYRLSRWNGILKSILWILPPIYLALQMPNLGLAVSLFFMMALLLSIAVWKDWFQIKKIPFLTAFWGAVLILPLAFAPLAWKLNWIKEYQKDRILAFFGHQNNYLMESIQECVRGSKMLGYTIGHVSSNALTYSGDYILASVSAYYGFLIAIIIIALLMLLIVKVFRIAFHQKNQLGMIIGYACGIVFMTVTVFNILLNLGILPPAYTTLPFFSYGGSSSVVFYILIGFVLSIYRYKNILPNKVHTKKIAS